MAAKKKRSGPPWQVILEEIRSQNRATIEAVEVNRATVEGQLGDLRRELTVRMGDLERGLTGRMENLETGLTARMDALEKRWAESTTRAALVTPRWSWRSGS